MLLIRMECFRIKNLVNDLNFVSKLEYDSYLLYIEPVFPAKFLRLRFRQNTGWNEHALCHVLGAQGRFLCLDFLPLFAFYPFLIFPLFAAGPSAKCLRVLKLTVWPRYSRFLRMFTLIIFEKWG
jgi:hypothetical protein